MLIPNLSNFPTAWVCVNDNTAMASYKALRELDIKVPDEPFSNIELNTKLIERNSVRTLDD